MKRSLLAFVLFLFAAPAFAQHNCPDPADCPSAALKEYRQEYPTPMDTREHIGELLNRVAWEFRDQGMKLLGKNGGSNCPLPNGVLISCDYLVHAPSFSGHDVFGDAGAGGQTTPSGFSWGPGPEDFISSLKDGSRTFVDPIEPRPELLLKRPTAATDVSPKNGDGKITAATTTQLVWASNGDTFDVAFGTVNPPPLVETNVDGTSYPVTLKPGTLYFWRIDARNAKGVTVGPTWGFATLFEQAPPVDPPPVVEPPAPVDPPVVTPPVVPPVPTKITLKSLLLYIVAGIAAVIFCAGGGCR